MASGHEYRANRPNTWLLRPLLQSEDSSCQPGVVHTATRTDECPLQDKADIGLLGEEHQEMLALFRALDPRLKRLVMSRAVEILARNGLPLRGPP